MEVDLFSNATRGSKGKCFPFQRCGEEIVGLFFGVCGKSRSIVLHRKDIPYDVGYIVKSTGSL